MRIHILAYGPFLLAACNKQAAQPAFATPTAAATMARLELHLSQHGNAG